MGKSLSAFLRDEGGSTAVEYSTIIALVSAASIAAFDQLGQALVELLDGVTAMLRDVIAGLPV